LGVSGAAKGIEGPGFGTVQAVGLWLQVADVDGVREAEQDVRGGAEAKDAADGEAAGLSEGALDQTVEVRGRD